MTGKHCVEEIDILRATDEGVADEIGAFDDSDEISLVFCRERRQTKGRIGQVDALFGFQLCATGLGSPDQDDGLALGQAFHHGFELAVVVAQSIPDRKPGDHFRQGDGRREGYAFIYARRAGRDQSNAVSRLQAGLLFDGGNRACSDLGTCNIHQHLDVPTDDSCRIAHESGHGAPGFGTVMGAVDARHIHAGTGKIKREVRAVGCLAGQRDHDACTTPGWRSAEQGEACCLQSRLAGKKVSLQRHYSGIFGTAHEARQGR